jgi:hypothetical protein
MRCRDATANSFVVKVRCEVFAHFHAFPVKKKVIAVCGIECLVCPDELFVNKRLDFKENDEHALDFAFSPVPPFFGLGDNGTFPLGGFLLCLRAITVNPSLVSSDNPGQEGQRFAQNVLIFGVASSDSSLNRIKSQHVQPTA